MEKYFPTLFEDVRREQLLIFSVSVATPVILKHSKSRDNELNIVKNIDGEKLHGQGTLKEYVAVQL